jgi:hypothetical protein
MKWTLVLMAALLSSGCFRTTVRSGHPPSDPAEGFEQRWHSGWVGGSVEASGPHDLARACPHGWAQIETKTDASQGLITLLTLSIYSPQTVTVVCAAPPSKRPLAPPAPKGI